MYLQRKQQIVLILLMLALMLLVCGIITYRVSVSKDTISYDSYSADMDADVVERGALDHIRDDFTVDRNFVSHLPIVIIDTNGTEPPINTKFIIDPKYPDGGLHMPIEGVEPYVDGKITVIDNSDEDRFNHLNDSPAYSGRISIKRRGNTSMSYEKAQWLVKLFDENGAEQEANLLDMGASNEWVLNGSMADKSMLRNYIAYSTASQLLNFTPDSRYCEVLIKDGDTLSYQGLYLMMENIRRGVNRVNISNYKETEAYNGYILKRDRFDPQGLNVENYSRLNGLSEEYISLVYPSKNKITDEMEEYINADINKIEEILYSDDPKVFATYKEVLDVDSFVDYFLLNEYFGNYDAGNNSTYFHKERGGKLTMGPVWDFDGAMDNYKYEPFDYLSIAFYTKPWFDRLCLDLDFLEKLEHRYLVLKRSVLDTDEVCDRIDEVILYLGDSIDREWYRWGETYKGDNALSLQDYELEDGTILKRDAKTYDDEIFRIKTMICEHSKYIYKDIRMLEADAVFNTGKDEVTGWLLLLAATLFIVPAVIAVYRQ
ncbi:MAG: CotH kinase family protein [Lachnospiraceae bacterium]|nr:CotH kinase family protein [Lachnospiraceae bacterium]